MKKILISIDISILFLIILILITALIILNITIYNYFKEYKDDLLLNLKKTTGYDIEYKKISPHILGKINIFEVEIYNSNSSRLELGNVEIDYSILNFLISRKSPVSLIKKISFKSFNLKINNENDLNEIKKLFSNSNDSKKKSNTDIIKLIVEISKGKITLNKNNQNYVINIDDFKANINEKITVNSKLSVSLYKKNKLKSIFLNKFTDDVRLCPEFLSYLFDGKVFL